MPNLLQLQDGTKAYGGRELFVKAAFAVNSGEHVGVIGPNGAGKTTLFKILMQEEQLTSGQLIRAKGLRMGYLAQHDDFAPGQSVADYLSDSSLLLPLWELQALGVRLGLANSVYERPILELSGGYRMRAKLLKLLGQQPDLMLLDEPTNYLDLDSVLVLENFLQDYDGAFLLISHDREFLRRTTDHILELEGSEVTKYNGNLDDYFEQKEMLREQLEARALSLSEKRQRILDFVNRFGAKASKARQAQSRLKSLSKMENIAVRALPVGARIKIPEPVRTGKIILKLEHVSLGYGNNTVLKDIEFTVQNGAHIAVVGHNGAGKSTFLKAVAGLLPPIAGKIAVGHQVSLGYYAQHVSENLSPHHTVLQAIQEKAHADIRPQDVLNMAGSLLFSGDDVHKKIAVLSGGEKSRVALGQILLQRAPCLILDEPTNHLDFQTVEALTQSLMAYAGTVVVVSHDRSFIRRIGTQIIEIRDGQARLYLGSYEDYVWSLQQGALATQNPNSTAAPKPAAKPAKDNNSGLKRKDLEARLRQCEKKLRELEASIAQCQAQIAECNTKFVGAASGEKNTLMQLMVEIQAQIEAFEEKWLSLGGEKEKLVALLS